MGNQLTTVFIDLIKEEDSAENKTKIEAILKASEVLEAGNINRLTIDFFTTLRLDCVVNIVEGEIKECQNGYGVDLLGLAIKHKKLDVLQYLLEATDGCYLLLMNDSPRKETLDSLPITAKAAAYVRVGEQLFYVNKISKQCIELTMQHSPSSFNEIMKVEKLEIGQSRKLSDAELSYITWLTDHTRRDLISLNHDETRSCCYTILEPLEVAIIGKDEKIVKQLLLLGANPKKCKSLENRDTILPKIKSYLDCAGYLIKVFNILNVKNDQDLFNLKSLQYFISAWQANSEFSTEYIGDKVNKIMAFYQKIGSVESRELLILKKIVAFIKHMYKQSYLTPENKTQIFNNIIIHLLAYDCEAEQDQSKRLFPDAVKQKKFVSIFIEGEHIKETIATMSSNKQNNSASLVTQTTMKVMNSPIFSAPSSQINETNSSENIRPSTPPSPA
jgi:hypothetical protein